MLILHCNALSPFSIIRVLFSEDLLSNGITSRRLTKIRGEMNQIISSTVNTNQMSFASTDSLSAKEFDVIRDGFSSSFGQLMKIIDNCVPSGADSIDD